MAAEPQPRAAAPKRVLANAVRIAMLLAMVGLAVQTGVAYFEDRPAAADVEDPKQSLHDLGDWTFAGEGLAMTVRSIDVARLEHELRGDQATPVDPSAPRGDAEEQLLKLLATLPAAGDGPDGRRFWRQTVAGIEVYAETCKSGGTERFAVARAAWSATGQGLSLLEIRPKADAAGNGSAAERRWPTPAGAVELARRVTANGTVTGSLSITSEAAEAAANAASDAFAADGWSVEPGQADGSSSARTMACRRGGDRLTVVVFRDENAADQTMIMCVRE